MRFLPRPIARAINRAALPVLGVPAPWSSTEVTNEQLADAEFDVEAEALIEAREAFAYMDRHAFGDVSLWAPWAARLQMLDLDVMIDGFTRKAQDVTVFMVRRRPVLVVNGVDYAQAIRWRNILASLFVKSWGWPL